MPKFYNGYIYIWYDTIAKLYYIGSHYGSVKDSYIASSQAMMNSYKKRPDTFKFKVLEYFEGDKRGLRRREQNWLNLIKPHELLLSENVKNNTHRYYNVKTEAHGGNGNANKGNSKIGGHNKGKPMSEEQKKKISASLKGRKLSQTHKQRISNAKRR